MKLTQILKELFSKDKLSTVYDTEDNCEHINYMYAYYNRKVVLKNETGKSKNMLTLSTSWTRLIIGF